MKSLNYYQTFICVSADCPVTQGTAPAGRGESPTVPQLEYELLSQNPGKYTQEEILFELHVRRQNITRAELKSQRAKLWKEFFGKSHACLRASSLPKRYGWGIHFDDQGKIRLVAMESDEYKSLSRGKSPGVTVVNAMRNKRSP